MMQVLDALQSPVRSADKLIPHHELITATQTSVWANPW